jgi:TRAP-type C4-dicarboxylate transport system permease small subunit
MRINKEAMPEASAEKSESKRFGLPDKAIVVILGMIVVVMFFQVFFRYALNNSLTWAEEITRFLFIWLVFLGTVINIRDKWNIGVDVLAGLLPNSFTRRLLLLDLFLVLAFLIFLTVSGFIWVYSSRGSYSSAVGWPLNLVLYGALPATSVLGCYYCVINIAHLFHRRREEKET